jgi:FkbM family methyltransferase
VLPLGIDYLWDIQRMAATHGIKVGCALDIGAHAGETAVKFLTSFPDAEIHSFEPHPDSFAFLEKVQSKRFHSHQLAMSNKRGRANFFVYREHEGDSPTAPASANNSLVQNRQFGLVTGQYTKMIQVNCDTVDHFCSDHDIQSVDVLKIDTEGHEVEVIDGATETIASRSVRFIFAEFETILPLPDATGGALAPIAERVEPLGFRLIATYPVNMVHRPLYAAFNALYFSLPRSVVHSAPYAKPRSS